MYSYGKRITSNTTGLDHQVCLNIAAETALAKGDRKALLTRFADELVAGCVPAEAWNVACRAHKFKGRPLNLNDCPGILGRVTSVRRLARLIKDEFRGELTQRQAERLLLRLNGKVESDVADAGGPFETMRDAPLGNFLIWATFNPDENGTDPFDRLPWDRRAICTALGLGDFEPDESLVILVWNHEASGSPPLHRPTIADAEGCTFFRPHTDPNARWGETCPLTPNDHGVGPQPEVVLRAITGGGLKFPIRIL